MNATLPFSAEPPRKWLRQAIALVLLLLLATALWRMFFTGHIVERKQRNVVIDMVLPPPLEPPKPEPEKKLEIKDEKTPVQPTEITEPQTKPEDFNDALTMQEGVTGNSFGAQVGEGGGNRIGGKAGNGDASHAYGILVANELKRILQTSPLARGDYEFEVMITTTLEGIVENVRFVRSSGEDRRDAAIQKLLVGQRISRPPPANLAPMMMAYRSRSNH